MEGYPEITEDNWKGGIQIEETNGVEGHEGYVRQYEPFVMPYVNILSAKSAYDFVLKNVGATLPCRDIVDQRIVAMLPRGSFVHTPSMASFPDSLQTVAVTMPSGFSKSAKGRSS